MSYTYIICGINISDDIPIALTEEVQLSANEFAEALTSKWADAKVRQTPEHATQILKWELTAWGNRSPFGGFEINPTIVSVQGGDLVHIAEFVLWYRSIVAADKKLFMYISSLNEDPLELEVNISKSTVIHHFGG